MPQSDAGSLRRRAALLGILVVLTLGIVAFTALDDQADGCDQVAGEIERIERGLPDSAAVAWDEIAELTEAQSRIAQLRAGLVITGCSGD